MEYIFLASLIISQVYLTVSLFLTRNALKIRYLNKTKPADSGKGISILKPLKGLDDSLEDNLRSFFEQEYLNLVKVSVDSKYVFVKWLGLTFVMLTALLIFGIERTYYRTANWLKISGLKNLMPADGELKLAAGLSKANQSIDNEHRRF